MFTIRRATVVATAVATLALSLVVGQGASAWTVYKQGCPGTTQYQRAIGLVKQYSSPVQADGPWILNPARNLYRSPCQSAYGQTITIQYSLYQFGSRGLFWAKVKDATYRRILSHGPYWLRADQRFDLHLPAQSYGWYRVVIRVWWHRTNNPTTRSDDKYIGFRRFTYDRLYDYACAGPANPDYLGSPYCQIDDTIDWHSTGAYLFLNQPALR